MPPSVLNMLLPESAEQIENIVRRVVREELDAQGVTGTQPLRLSLTLADAAAATGYSLDVIRQQIRNSYLVPSYANSKPVILVEELQRWLRALPADPR